MERLALAKLIEWNENRRKPLMVYGARQIGKTYLIKEIFAERFYKGHYIYIDFKKDDDAKDFVCGNGKDRRPTSDPKKILEFLSLRENRVIDKSVLLIFDEVQEALPIITSLKYFKQDYPDIPVIATGSMVRIKIKREQKIANQLGREGFFFPVGAIQELVMHPMSFEEFLLNDNKMLYEEIKRAYKEKRPLDHQVHKMAIDALYKHILIGGMPEDNKLYFDHVPLVEIRENMVALFNDYLNDMELYQVSSDSIVRSKLIFNSIFTQLNKESKDFKPSILEKGMKSRDLKSPLDWLVTSSVIYRCDKLKEIVTTPLMPESDHDYRLYVMDTGFLAYQSQINMSTFVNEGTRNTLPGVLFENYVACEMAAKGIPLFYWKGKGSAEFEFIINVNEQIIPLDVKKNKGVLSSLSKFKEHNKFTKAVKISLNNYGFDEATGILTIPLYMVFAFLNDVSQTTKPFLILD